MEASWEPGLATSFKLVRLVGCGLNRLILSRLSNTIRSVIIEFDPTTWVVCENTKCGTEYLKLTISRFVKTKFETLKHSILLLPLIFFSIFDLPCVLPPVTVTARASDSANWQTLCALQIVCIVLYNLYYYDIIVHCVPPKNI